MLAESPNGQQGLLEPWKNMCLSGLKEQVLVIQECGVCGFYDFPICHLDGERMDRFLFVAAW